MIPSVLSSQLSRAIREYLRTTFPVTTPLFHNALDQLFSEDGSVFKGPYLSLGLPFRKGTHHGEFFPEIPLGFTPHLHQAQSFERLGVSDPLSTIVATGTGSGKTECFLLPILDYCLRHADSNGIKTIIIYPMNALATDQAGRIARLIYDNPSLSGRVTAGLYIGQKGETIHRVMTGDSVITKMRKSCSGCQCIVRDFDPVYFVACDILRFCDILYEMYSVFWVVVSCHICFWYK